MRRTLAALSCLSSFTLLAGFATVGPAGTIARISYMTYDPPTLPTGGVAHPLLGPHYFGDWPFFVAFGDAPNPYLIYPLGLNGLPPSLWYFKASHAVPLGPGLLLMMALSAGLTFAATWLLLDHLPSHVRLLAWVACFGLSAGFLSSMDRGATQALAMGLVGLWLWALHNRPVAAGLLLAAAIAFKPYLGLLLLWPLVHHRWHAVIATSAAVVTTSVAGFVVLPGGLVTSVRGYLHVSSAYTSTRTGPLPDFATSLWRLDRGLPMMLPGAGWLLLVCWVLWRRRDSVALVLLLSCTQLVLPLSQPYTAVWAGLGAILLLRDPASFRGRAERAAVWVALAVTIVPLTLTYGGDVPWSHILSPLAWVAVGAVALVMTARRPYGGGVTRREELTSETDKVNVDDKR